MDTKDVPMAVKMNDFLLQYYMQMRFNHMPAEVRAKYDEYAKNDDFRGNMKDWKKNLMGNPMPDPTEIGGLWELGDDEWKKLFNAFQNAFRGMAADQGSFKENKDANNFLNEYFGDALTHLFSNSTASPDAEAQIQGAFKSFLLSKRNSLEIYFKQWGLTNDDFSYSDLIDGISKKEYNASPKFQNKIKQIAQYLTFYSNQPDFQTAIGINTPLDFNDIEKGFDDAAIDPQKLDYFKRNHRDLLDTLSSKSKVLDVFKNYDGGKISKHIATAKTKVNYDDKESDDYVPPKRQDELTPWQQLSKNTSDTWADYMDKYVKLRGDRLYMSSPAKLIVKALDGAKIKPTDGLGKVLENAGKIKENLRYKSPTATKHFDWFAKAIGQLKETMPKAFAGALKNGRQMRAIISELIMMAVRDGKTDEAKTAMEVLSVIKYGYTTSKIMDTLGKEKLSIFSDKGLSWNKNEGVQFVTTAMDKSIKAAFMGIGYGITIAGNAIKLNGSKFGGHDTKRMQTAHQDALTKNTNDLNDTVNETNMRNTQDNQIIQDAQNTINQTGITAATVAQKRQDLQNAQAIEEQKKNALDAARTQLNDTDKKLTEYAEITNDLNTVQQQLQQIQATIQQMQNALNNPDTFNGMSPQEADTQRTSLQQQIAGMQMTSATLQQTAVNLTARQQQAIPDVQVAIANRPAYEAAFNTAEADYNAASTNTAQLSEPIQQFDEANQIIDEMNTRIQKRDDEISNWDDNHQDKYRELIAYWDFLESGRDSRTGRLYSWRPGSASKKQKKFDQKSGALFQQYLNRYQYVP